MTPSTTWKEVIAEREPEQLERLGAQLRDRQRTLAQKTPVGRALHVKAQAGVLAELSVLPGLPEHARVGVFATEQTFRAFVRFSNGTATRQSDRKPDVRGVAIKLLGVPGPKIIVGLEQATTQDFLLIQGATTPFRNAEEFVWMVLAADRPALLVPRAFAHFGPMRAIALLRALLKGMSRPMTSVATSRYHSALPIAFGPYAAKYSLSPHAPPEAGAKAGTFPNYIGEELAARLARGPVVYDFQVQFYVDDERTPIEDSTREWTTDTSPFVTVARLTLPQQELGSERGKKIAETIEALSFDPWHTTRDFRPLGNLMRARNVAYRLSTIERHAAPEPVGNDWPA